MEQPVSEFVARYKALGLSGTPATSEEVDALQRAVGTTFPAAYRAFLIILGRDGGKDFVGSDCTVKHVPKLRVAAERLLQSCGSTFKLPEQAVIFLMHQGCFFLYFVADGKSADPPVFAYQEGEDKPTQKAASFTAWLQL